MLQLEIQFSKITSKLIVKEKHSYMASFFLGVRKLNRAGSFCAILARKLEPAGIFFANLDDFGQVHSG